MGVKEVVSADRPTERLYQPAESLVDNIELIEVANLASDKTGVDGVIYISTAQARHAPCVKWYPGRPKEKAPCLSVTIEPTPNAFNHHLPARVFDSARLPVKAWVTLNYQDLLEFWNAGNNWMDDEVDAFKKSLKKID